MGTCGRRPVGIQRTDSPAHIQGYDPRSGRQRLQLDIDRQHQHRPSRSRGSRHNRHRGSRTGRARRGVHHIRTNQQSRRVGCDITQGRAHAQRLACGREGTGRNRIQPELDSQLHPQARRAGSGRKCVHNLCHRRRRRGGGKQHDRRGDCGTQPETSPRTRRSLHQPRRLSPRMERA